MRGRCLRVYSFFHPKYLRGVAIWLTARFCYTWLHQGKLEATAETLINERGRQMATILKTADVVSAKATTETVNKVSRYAEVKALIANLEKEETQLKADILEAFGEATLLTHRNLEVARLDERTRTTNDSKKLAELFPEAYEATKRSTAYMVIFKIFR